MKRFDVVTVGLQTLDLVVPEVLDEKIFTRDLTLVDGVQLLPGGDALNEAIVLSQLGARTALVGALGNDGLGDSLLALVQSHSVTAYEQRVDAPTALSIILLDAARERHFIYQPGHNLAFRYEDLDTQAVEEARIVCIGGALALPRFDGAGTRRLLERAKAAGALTAMDLRIGNVDYDRSKLKDCLPLTDYLLPSEWEAEWLTGVQGDAPRMAAELHALGAKNCVIKLGSKGCYVSADGVEDFVASYPCRCVDTTGAGDTFVGAFLYAKTRGWDVLECARFACAAGSIAVEHKGANQAITGPEQVLARMRGEL